MPRIAQETIDRVLAASDVVDVIGGYFPLKRAGGSYVALCPFHREKTPSFHVNPSRQHYHCFGCGASGSVFRFVMEYENVDFPEAVQRLAQRAGIPVVLDADGQDERVFRQRRRLLELHRFAAEWFMERLLEHKDGAQARQYLKGRGFNREIAERWKIGYAPDSWDAFSSAARNEGFKAGELVAAGLAAPRNADRIEDGIYDRFRGRAMFSISNDVGEVVAFSGRLLQADAKAAKYVNSPETALFKKGQLLFGLHQSKRPIIEAECAVMCEGQIDLIRMFESGIRNVVAPQGTAFTELQARAIRRLSPRVILLFDGDNAGRKAAEAAFRVLIAQTATVHLAALPAGSDPDQFLQEEGPEALQEMLDNAPEFFECQLIEAGMHFDLANPQGRLAAGRHFAGLLGAVQEPILLDAMLQSAASRLSIPAVDLQRLMREGKRSNRGKRFEAADEPEPERASLPPLNVGDATLCRILLQLPEARRWILSQPWRETLERLDDSQILRMVIEGDFDPGNQGSILQFLAAQENQVEALLTGVLDKPLPEQPEQVLEECWRGLQHRALIARRDLLFADLKAGSAKPEVMEELQTIIRQLAGTPAESTPAAPGASPSPGSSSASGAGVGSS